MQQSPTVLVADSDDNRRRNLGLALYGGGYEVVNAVDGDEAARFTSGLDPTLVVIHEGLAGEEPIALFERLRGTGLAMPPFLVLCHELPETHEDLPEELVYFLKGDDLEPDRFLQQVRLLLLARDVGGDLSDTIDVLYGDLTRISIQALLRVLTTHRVTGEVSLSVGQDAGFWVEEGAVVDARWGVARGRKAFHRMAVLRGGSFVLRVAPAEVERTVEVGADELIAGAEEERLGLDELLRGLPPLGSRPELQMGDEFFQVEFTPVEREVLTRAQDARTLGDLVDEVPYADLEAVTAVAALWRRGFLLLHQPEQRVHVVTDSTCDLLPAVTRALQVTVVPLSVLFGTTVYKDGVDLQPDQFYSILRTSQVFPSTSPPGKGEFLETYRQLVATGDVVCVHISRKQSLTGQHAEEAAQEGAAELAAIREQAGGGEPPVVRVVDSWSNCVGLGLQVLFATRLAQRGCTADEIAAHLEGIRERLHFLFAVDTLEFLKRGGRIGKAQAFLGTLLGIKPILGMQHGEVVPVDKVRGGRRVQPRLVELFKQRLPGGQPVFAAMAHASAPKWAERLKQLLHESFDVVELLEGEIGPVVGAHTGPGTVGAILFAPTEEELELLRPQ